MRNGELEWEASIVYPQVTRGEAELGICISLKAGFLYSPPGCRRWNVHWRQSSFVWRVKEKHVVMAILGGKSPFFRPALSMSDLSTCQRPATLPFWEVLKLQLKVSEDYLHDLGALTRSPSGTKIIKQTAIRLKVQCIFMSVYLYLYLYLHLHIH